MQHAKEKLMRAGPGEDWVKCKEEQGVLRKPPGILGADELGIDLHTAERWGVAKTVDRSSGETERGTVLKEER